MNKTRAIALLMGGVIALSPKIEGMNRAQIVETKTFFSQADYVTMTMSKDPKEIKIIECKGFNIPNTLSCDFDRLSRIAKAWAKLVEKSNKPITFSPYVQNKPFSPGQKKAIKYTLSDCTEQGTTRHLADITILI